MGTEVKGTLADIATLVFMIAVCCALGVFIAISVGQGNELERVYERLNRVHRYEVVRVLDTEPKIIAVHDHLEEAQTWYVEKGEGDLYLLEGEE